MNKSLSSLHLQLAGLPTAAKNDFDFWRTRFRPLLETGNRKSETGKRRTITAELAAIATTTGTPFRTVRNKFYGAKRNGLIALVDRRLAGPSWWRTKGQIAISESDKELVKLYCGNNQRSSRSAVKQLRRDWVRGRIKTETPVDPRTSHPRGWSIDNLVRYAPTKFELKAVRIGRSAAASERPLVYTTRKGLYVGSHIMIDDMWHDFEINTFVESQAGRPLELAAHDLFPAYKRRWGIRVRTRRDDGSHNQLTERMTRFILAATLFLDGYSPRGTIICAEHGMAAVRDAIERALFDMSDGLIKVARSGMTGAAAHAGQYPGISRGNFRFKASLESSHNLTHNVFAALPGQVGKDRNHTPEQMHDGGPRAACRKCRKSMSISTLVCARCGSQDIQILEAGLLWENDALLAARRYLSEESVALLEFPILELNQFMQVAHELYQAIHEDPDHDLEGWVESGLIVNELLMGGQWIDQRLLLQDAAQSVLATELIQAGQLQTRPRKMTRGEVWRAGAGELVRIPGYGVCAILGDDLAFPRKVSSNMFEFEDREVGPGVHRYAAIAKTPHGEELRLADGEKYETFVNPFAPDTLFVRRGNGAYIGECRRIEKPCRGDVEAVHRACGAAAKTEAELLQPIRARHLTDAREKARRHERNAAVLGGGPVTPEEKHEARIEENRTRSAARFGEICAHLAKEKEAGDQKSEAGSQSETEEEIETW